MGVDHHLQGDGNRSAPAASFIRDRARFAVSRVGIPPACWVMSARGRRRQASSCGHRPADSQHDHLGRSSCGHNSLREPGRRQRGSTVPREMTRSLRLVKSIRSTEMVGRTRSSFGARCRYTVTRLTSDGSALSYDGRGAASQTHVTTLYDVEFLQFQRRNRLQKASPRAHSPGPPQGSCRDLTAPRIDVLEQKVPCWRATGKAGRSVRMPSVAEGARPAA